MRMFRTSKKIDGWRAISFQENSICAVHIRRPASGKPQVTLAVSHSNLGYSLSESLERLAREWQGQNYQCTTLLDSSEYQFLPVEAPNVPPLELKSAISWLLKDMLDFHVDEAIIDVLNIPQEKNAPQRNRAMYAVAARSKIIQERQRMFEEAKIPLRVIDVPEMAQRNIAALLEPPNRGLALLSFDARGGLLTLSHGGELYLARRIDITLDQLRQADDDQMVAWHDRIALEIMRSLDHFGRQYHSIVVSKLMLAPLSELGGNLQVHLSENLDVPVESLDFSTVLDLSLVPELNQLEQQQDYFLALGAALRLEEKAL